MTFEANVEPSKCRAPRSARLEAAEAIDADLEGHDRFFRKDQENLQAGAVVGTVVSKALKSTITRSGAHVSIGSPML